MHHQANGDHWPETAFEEISGDVHHKPVIDFGETLLQASSIKYSTVLPAKVSMKKSTRSTPAHRVGDHVRVKLSGGRIVEATIKAIVETTGRALAGLVRRRDGVDLSVADPRRASLIVRSAPIVEERRVRRQAGALSAVKNVVSVSSSEL